MMNKKPQEMNVQNSKQEYRRLLNSLVDISINGLKDMFLPDQLEFASMKRMVDNNIIIEGTNTRYTLISIIGLHKAESHNKTIGINLFKILANQISKVDKYNGIGDLGLLLWASALVSPGEIDKILTKINFNNILNLYKNQQNKLTMELSWFLTGVLMASTFNETFKNTIGDLPEKVFKLIRDNYGASGIFKHQVSTGFSGKFRSNIGSFADQVYPIYAFSLYAQIKKNYEALLIAKECAFKICEHQSTIGEWLWHYDSRNGKTISKYPIYSVHQDAMAPIALFAIQRATNINFDSYIYKGLDWLVENNSLNENMIDIKNNLIWSGIGPRDTERKIKSTLKHIGFRTKEEYSSLEIVKECWSYHLGWVLYAFAGRVEYLNKKKTSFIEQKDTLKLFNFSKN